MKNYYYLDSSEEVQGPFKVSDLDSMHKGGRITSTTQICEEGTQNWMPFFQVPRPTVPKQLPVVASIQKSLPDTPPAEVASAASITEKRILPAFILAFLLGVFGVHAFYAGQIFQGVIYLLMWISFVVLGAVNSGFQGIPLLCVAVFALSDIIRIVVGAYKDGEVCKDYAVDITNKKPNKSEMATPRKPSD